MGKPTWDALLQLDLSALQQAVADWKAVVRNLEPLVGEARDGMKRRSEQARWAGVNADVTRSFVRVTADEFAGVLKEASSIQLVLDTACTDLGWLKAELTNLRDIDAKKADVIILGNRDGTVTCSFPCVAGEEGKRSEADIREKDRIEDRANALLREAAELDTSITVALRKCHGGDPHNFGHKRYVSMDEIRAIGETEDAVSEYTRPDSIPLPGPAKDAVSFLSYRSWINSGASLVKGGAGYAEIPGGDKSALNKAPDYFLGGLPAFLAGEGSKGLAKHGGGSGAHRAPGPLTTTGNVLSGLGKVGSKVFGLPASLVATGIDYANDPASDPEEKKKHSRVLAPGQLNSTPYS
ncbi:hypothetical protein ACQEU8_19680 [Streptomyces sp. CA-250714]|uniref:hypothetical protein n=1 Tax=Streptomyces sp. CA-250714 TaxID=3240060 RepID=UPI003D8E6861